jgi:hypothetical protein
MNSLKIRNSYKNKKLVFKFKTWQSKAFCPKKIKLELKESIRKRN